jgi:SAM-dependent methyltransferase
MSSSPMESYEAMPFLGGTIAHAHPEFLETVARVRGMQPAAAAGARVLELGCGVGNNLLPTAERYPAAELLGVDFSGRQIAMAQATARECSLDNVEFRQQDILQLGFDLGEFDYIIAHGVYSWVEAPVRDMLLAICRDHLAADGVAYFGYKTYPGWHLSDMIRQAMLDAAQGAIGPSEQIARSRMVLDFLQTFLPQNDPLATSIRSDVSKLAQFPDDYLCHDYLESVSYPVYFRQFVAHAKSYALDYLGDAALGIRWAESLGPEAEQRLAAISPDPIQQETFRDFLFNRPFRQTLLCHQGVPLVRSTSPDSLDGLYLEGGYRPQNERIDFCSSADEEFVHQCGGRITTADGLLKAALGHLGEAWPGYVRFEDLVAAACRRLEAARLAPVTPAETGRLRHALVDCCQRSVILLHSHAELFVPTPSQSPVASLLARHQARQYDRVSSRRHETVSLNPLDRWLLVLLDGHLTRQQLVGRASAAWAEGRLVVSKQAGQPRTYDDALRFFEVEVDAALKRLAEAALLVA